MGRGVKDAIVGPGGVRAWSEHIPVSFAAVGLCREQSCVIKSSSVSTPSSVNKKDFAKLVDCLSNLCRQIRSTVLSLMSLLSSTVQTANSGRPPAHRKKFYFVWTARK